MGLRDELDRLHDTDIYSLMLFVLYKMKNINEYSALSELVYVLDKDSLLKLCEYFGGLTITIPTIDELEILIHTLTLYQFINFDNIEYEEAIKLINCKSDNLRDIKKYYIKLCEVLDKYKFERRCN